MTFGADIMSPVDRVRNLGVHMDQHLTMTLYRLSATRHCLTTEATKSAVDALMTSRLDYSNSFLASHIFHCNEYRTMPLD